MGKKFKGFKLATLLLKVNTKTTETYIKLFYISLWICKESQANWGREQQAFTGHAAARQSNLVIISIKRKRVTNRSWRSEVTQPRDKCGICTREPSAGRRVAKGRLLAVDVGRVCVCWPCLRAWRGSWVSSPTQCPSGVPGRCWGSGWCRGRFRWVAQAVVPQGDGLVPACFVFFHAAGKWLVFV